LMVMAGDKEGPKRSLAGAGGTVRVPRRTLTDGYRLAWRKAGAGERSELADGPEPKGEAPGQTGDVGGEGEGG
jgi:hypothetical protein